MKTVAESMTLGWQCYQAGNLMEAEQAYRGAVQSDAGNAQAWCMLGIVCRARGDLVQAAASYREAVRLLPDFVEAHNNLGNVLVLQGELTEAVACYGRVLRLRPGFVEAHNNLGAALRHLGRLAEAVDCYREALRLRPDYADAHNNLGDALSQIGRTDEAVAHYREAIRLRPDFAGAYNNLGSALRHQGQFSEALDCYRQALRLVPHSADAHYNLGSLFMQQGGLEEAVASYREAIRLKPDYAEAHFHLGQALRAQGHPEEALAVYQRLLQIRPDNPEAHLSRALTWLLLGDYEHGWPEYEWRLQCKGFYRPPLPQPRWDGSPLHGRTILLHAEQGLGDTLQFVRYAPLVKERGGTVILACPKTLLRLLAGCPGIDRLLAADADPPPFDVHAALPSLPSLFGTSLANVPAPLPYLFADPALSEQWRRELAAYSGFKVGIAWQGNPKYLADRYRSFPLVDFEPLARVPGVHLFSLQKAPGAEQLQAALPFPVHDLGPRLDEVTGPFMDTAAVMKNLDLVITVDTALAHLAGALGVSAWVVLSSASDSRWMLERDNSPWYPTLRLFRQQAWGGGDRVFARVAAALRERVAALAGPLMMDIDVGELIDRITILEIKRDRLSDPEELRDVRRELGLMAAARAEAVPPSDELCRLTAELKATNEMLWQAKDDLRLCEQTGDFGPRFVELARSVYQTNNQRAALKHRINDQLRQGKP